MRHNSQNPYIFFIFFFYLFKDKTGDPINSQSLKALAGIINEIRC